MPSLPCLLYMNHFLSLHCTHISLWSLNGRFPFIACEIFTCDVEVIFKTLVEDDEVSGTTFSVFTLCWGMNCPLKSLRVDPWPVQLFLFRACEDIVLLWSLVIRPWGLQKWHIWIKDWSVGREWQCHREDLEFLFVCSSWIFFSPFWSLVDHMEPCWRVTSVR